jgi:predicted permease
MPTLLADLATDFRFAFRVMRKSVMASVTIMVCLGFSVGATGAVFVWTRSVVSNPVPGVKEPERLVSLRSRTARGDGLVSHPIFREIRDMRPTARPAALAEIAAFGIERFAVRTSAETELRRAEPIWGAATSADYFDVIGARPVIGRTFLPDEDRVGSNAAVAVISDGLWRRRFAASTEIRGQRFWINNREVTIVGVMPPRFTGTISRLGLEIWVPLELLRQLGDARFLDDRNITWLDVVGRLTPDGSLETANAAANGMGRELSAQFREFRDVGLEAQKLDVGPVERMAPLFKVMLGLSILVVLIVCSNVANLLLLRSAAREHEIAVRLALGARARRVVRQLMTESLLLAIGGVILAVGFAIWSRNTLSSFAPASPLPLVVDTPFDGTVLAVIATIGFSTVFAFGLAPALKSTRIAVRASLTGGGTRGGTSQGGRLRGALVSAQFALSLAVLATAGLFIRRLNDLQLIDRGFRAPEQVLLSTIDFDLAGIRDRAIQEVLTERIIERIKALPGIEDAAIASFVPLGFLGYFPMTTEVPGYAPQPGESMSFLTNSISGNYFETMGIPILAGRGVEMSDRSDSRPVAVVNLAFVRRFWSDGNAVGRVMKVRGQDVTVVGVAADGKYEFLAPLDDPSPPFIYLPVAQWPRNSVVLHVRTTGAPLTLIGAVRGAVESVDGQLTVTSPSTLDAYSSVPYLPIRVASRVLTILGIGALILATLGLYAVIGYAVAQQRAEIGIRMALGASPNRIVRHFMRYAALYAGIGAAFGTVLALAIARGLASKLPGSVPPMIGNQIGPFLIAVMLLGFVAVFAAFIPAQGAARVSPTVALREE